MAFDSAEPSMTGETATIKITVKGKDYGTFPVEVDSQSSLYDVINANFSEDNAVYDDFYPVWEGSRDFCLLTSFCLENEEFVRNYPVEGGCMYVSNCWAYSVNGVIPQTIIVGFPDGTDMGDCIPKDGDVIELMYDEFNVFVPK